LFCLVASPGCGAQDHLRQYQFEQYPAKLYDGPIKIPEGLHQDEDGAWRDALEKWVADPEVTFAGEYYLAGHSCGAGCRYYELTNLRTGTQSKDIAQFNATEERPRTPDGHPYLTILFSRPNSRLLIAKYLLDFDDPQKAETCRQQYFLFENRKLRAISKVFSFCTEDRDNRE
jgi:hypothetical protein